MLPPLLEVYTPASPIAAPPAGRPAAAEPQTQHAAAASQFGEAAAASVGAEPSTGPSGAVPMQQPASLTAGSPVFMAPSLSGIVTGAGRRMRRAPQVYEAEPAPAPRVAKQLAEAKRRCVSGGDMSRNLSCFELYAPMALSVLGHRRVHMSRLIKDCAGRDTRFISTCA